MNYKNKMIRTYSDRRRFIYKLLAWLFGIWALVILGTISYAFFTASGRSNPQKANLSTAKLALRFADNDNGLMPTTIAFGETVTKKFLIENTGTAAASLSLDWKDLVNTYINGSLTYKLMYATEEDGEYKPIEEASVDGTNVPVSSTPITQTMIGEISVPKDETYYYNLEITLNNLPDVNQNADLEATFQTRFDVNQPIGKRNYRLSVDPNGGEWGETSSISEFLLTHEGTKEIANPSRTGYRFAGWDVEGVGYELTDNTFKMGISDANLTAKWDANKHQVTIDGEEREMAFDEEIDLGTPTRTGYRFDGWSASGGTLSGTKFTLTSDEDVTITSNWTALSYNYTVIHRQMKVDGSDYEEVSRSTESLAYGEKVTAPVNTYTGFTSPDEKEITITEDESKNIVTYDYRRNQYDIAIDLNGGSYSGETTYNDVYFGSTIKLDKPSKTGYTFTRWTAPVGETTDSSYVVGAGNATVTANYDVNNYKYIVYHKQMNTDGVNYTTVEADTVRSQGAYGSSVTPPVKTYTGFTSPGVKSWTIGVDTDPPTKNLFEYLYGRQKYNLTIKPNGGVYGGKTSDTVLSKYYQDTETLSDPTREGYTLKGWTNTGGSLVGSTFTMSDANHSSVEAKWEVNQYDYKVYHRQMSTDGTTYNVVSSDTVSSKANYGTTISPEVKAYTGFTSPSQRSMVIGVDTTQNVITYDYTRNQYTLTVNPDGGTYNKSTSPSVYYGQSYDLGTATKTGYNSSWQKVSGAGTLSGSNYTIGNGVATVKAVYTPKTFTVTFNANGGTTSTTNKEVSYDSTYGDLPTPTYSGYNFLGWFTSASGGTEVTKETVVKLSGNQTLYAHWEQAIKPLLSTILAKANSVSITDYNSGNKGEMYTFSHPATAQTTALTDYRYIGSNPNNYITFNDETWRIIGVFTVETEDGAKQQLVKIIRDASIGDLKWNSTQVNGAYTNEWTNGSLHTLLNSGDYYNQTGSYTSTSSNKGLSATARSQIAKVKFYLGGSTTHENLGGPDYYAFERGTTTYQNSRQTSIMQSVGLMYPSDYVYTYANGVDEICYTNGYNCNTSTPTNGWLFNSRFQWTQSPYARYASYAFDAFDEGLLRGDLAVNGSIGVRPTVYLASNILIEGTGEQGNPYTIKP